LQLLLPRRKMLRSRAGGEGRRRRGRGVGNGVGGCQVCCLLPAAPASGPASPWASQRRAS
jgi:hypothetical protein